VCTSTELIPKALLNFKNNVFVNENFKIQAKLKLSSNKLIAISKF
jgi:hypothetical protein